MRKPFLKVLKRAINSELKTQYEKSTGKIDWEYRLSEIYYGFLDSLFYNWISPVEEFFQKCYTIYKWFPVLWKDKDFDYVFILKIWQHKLKCMREFIDKHGIHLHKDRDIKNIRTAELILDRLIKDDYVTKEWRDYLGNKGSDPRETRRLIKRERYMRGQDFVYLGEHLRKHMTSWWD